jgi:PIN domain nuclease of toxin-antitoxin system
MKWGSRKIVIPTPPRAWIEEQARTWRTVALPLSRRAIYRATELPALHRDPFDRLLVASALEENATIVTPDEAIRRYPVSCVW